MKTLSVVYSAMQGLLFLTIVINAAEGGVSLPRVINSSINEAKSSTMRRTSDLDLAISMGNTHQVNKASERMPPRPIPTNEMTAIEENDVPILSRSLREDDDPGCTTESKDKPVDQVGDLDTYLNAISFFLGLNPDLKALQSIIKKQPDSCPSNNTWNWPGPEENLRSVCPWRWNVTDLSKKPHIGLHVHPRYVLEAHCICPKYCIGTHGKYGCSQRMKNITVFEKTGCVGDHATVVKKSVSIAVGCYCHDTTRSSVVIDPSGLPPLST